MHARSTTVMGQPGMLETGIAHARDVVMPQVRAMEGCLGMSLLADRMSGRCIVTTAWRDEEAMRATTDAVIKLRGRMLLLFWAARPRSTSGRSPTSTVTTAPQTVPARG